MRTIRELLNGGLVGVGIMAVIMATALPYMPLKASINATDCIERVAYKYIVSEQLQDYSEQI